jgi:hypothetical protein
MTIKRNSMTIKRNHITKQRNCDEIGRPLHMNPERLASKGYIYGTRRGSV